MPSFEELRISYNAKSTEQLLDILRTPQDWSDEALSAAKTCLLERGVNIQVTQTEASEPSNNRVRYAGLFDRLIASMIDSFIIVVPSIIISFIVFQNNPNSIEPFATFLCIVGGWLYCAFQESSTHMATVGKRTMGIKVCDYSNNRITFGQASGRHFAKYISSIFMLGFIMAIFTKRNQGLHDLMSGSILYSEK